MPIYEYKCQKCHHQFDTMQKINDKPLKICPICHKETLKKCVTAPNFQLKGSGWYETDYKKKNKPKDKIQNETEKTCEHCPHKPKSEGKK